MTSIINNSNANSALINTLEASDSKVNPNIYSTKIIYPASAATVAKCQLANGTSDTGGTMNFNLMKYGIITQILFNWKKNFTTGGADLGGVSQGGDFANIISKVELLSSSRVVSILTSADLIAQFSDLDVSRYLPIKRAAVDSRSTGAASHTYCIPFTFGFCREISTQLASSFLEPLSIRITFGQCFNAGGATTAVGGGHPSTGTLAANAITDTYLSIKYKNYNEADTSAILAENYSSPQLNMCSMRFYDENAVTTGTAASSAVVELKNTDVVMDYFILVRPILPAVAADAGVNAAMVSYLGNPVEIKGLTFTASGQEICDLNEQEIVYSRLTADGFSVSPMGGLDIVDSANMRYVAKIQTGLYNHSGSGPLSGLQSLRELNAPQITVSWDGAALHASIPGISTPATTAYRVDVVERCAAIYSVSSATGRLSLALSN